jgi:hypothetical protein
LGKVNNIELNHKFQFQQEIPKALRNLKNYKPPGEDNGSVALMKNRRLQLGEGDADINRSNMET